MKKHLSIVLIVSAASTAGAQSVRVADSLVQSGALARAESIYYAAVRVRPRDAIARWSLGRFLVARGAPRVGATLFEEALQFGGERAIVERDLAKVYLAIGEYRPLAALTSASPPERERAQWLAARDSRIIAPETLIVAAFEPSNDTGSLGRIPIRVNGRTLDAVVSVRTQGIVVSDTTSAAQRLRKFPASGDAGGRVLATADSIGVGRLLVHNVPVTVARLEDQQTALIGLDVLAKYAPTFDPKGGRVTLRVGGVASPRPAGTRLSTWNAGTDVRVLSAGGWVSLTQPQMWRLLRDHRWTYDARRGEIIVEP